MLGDNQVTEAVKERIEAERKALGYRATIYDIAVGMTVKELKQLPVRAQRDVVSVVFSDCLNEDEISSLSSKPLEVA